MAFVVTAIAADVVTVASIAAAVGELGVALSVVGAVTGNKTISKVGGILGLAGGIGSIAAGFGSAMASGAADATAADTIGSTASDMASNDILDTASAQGGTAYGSGVTSNAASNAATGGNGLSYDPTTGLDPGETPEQADALDQATNADNRGLIKTGPGPYDYGLNPELEKNTSGIINDASNQSVSNQANIGSDNGINASGASNGPNAAVTPPQQGIDTSTPQGGTPVSNDILDTQSAQGGTNYGTNIGSSGVGSTSSQSVLGGLSDWINKNPKAANMYGQLASGALSGMGRAYEANRVAQINQGYLNLKQQAQNNANSQVKSAGIITSQMGKS